MKPGLSPWFGPKKGTNCARAALKNAVTQKLQTTSPKIYKCCNPQSVATRPANAVGLYSTSLKCWQLEKRKVVQFSWEISQMVQMVSLLACREVGKQALRLKHVLALRAGLDPHVYLPLGPLDG